MMHKSCLILKSDKIAKPKSIKNKITSHIKDGYEVTVNKIPLSKRDKLKKAIIESKKLLTWFCNCV